MKEKIKKISMCFLTICMVIGITSVGKMRYNVKAAQKFKIHFIDVGCADAALLQYGEGKDAKYAMIDSGAEDYHETKDKTIDQTKTPAYEYLNKLGIKHLEFVILTHPHQDHIGGMIKILSDTSIQIDRIYGNDLNIEYLRSSDDKDEQSAETARWTQFDKKVFNEFKQVLEERKEKTNIEYRIPVAGEQISLGDAKITFYGPLENDYQYGRKVDLNVRQENKYSIVTKIVYGNNSFLMTGDAQKETIEKIIAKGYDLRAQVLKEPHHGYQDITEEELEAGYQYSDHKLVIDKSEADIAIISNGYKNESGVPYAKVKKDLSKLDVYQTSDKGTIIVTSDGSKLSILTQKGGTAPSMKGSESEDVTASPVMKSMKITANTTKPLRATTTSAQNTYTRYEKKNITVKFSGTAKAFTTLSSIQYKFVPKGVNNTKIAYKTGKSITVKDGNCGRIYVKYNTPLGSTQIKLPGFTVDTKAPKNAKIKANKSGIKTLATSKKNTYKKAYKKSIKFSFSADYGISGKAKVQYKIVPKGKKASKYQWKTANTLTYKTKNKKVRLYVRFVDKAGNTTTKKTNGFYIKK